MSTIINATTTNGVVIQPDNSGSLQLATNSGTTALTIDTSQNVGIGTTTISPGYIGGYGSLTLKNAKSIAFNNASDTWSTTTTGGAITYFVDNNLYIDAKDSASNMIFRVNAATERMRIDSSGNVLVNTTTIRNNGRVSVDFNGASAGGMGINDTASSNGSAFIAFLTGGTFRGSITNNNNTGVTYGTSSDYRLKEDILPMTGALDKVAQLKPVTYKWKIDGSDGQGFIAHELAEVVPDCVVGEKDAVDEEGNPKYQGVDTSYLVATLTAAIQEQTQIINDLKARIETLEIN